MSDGHPERIGKYEIRGLLGCGGMGMVYRAFDAAIDREVAIKSITKSATPSPALHHAIARFRHEARAIGRLSHPRIAAIYDYGEDDHVAYIVMELVSGKSLHEHLQSGASFGLQEIGELIRQLLDGLAYAHARGVVHRDIKPSNLLIDEEGHVRIGDFGIARIDSSALTQVGEIMGSPGYMSPEQFSGDEPDARADIYAAGVIAYELLTGRKPFVGNNLEIMRQVIGDMPRKPSGFNPRVSARLDQAVLKALAKQREGRFQAARDFALAFVQGVADSLRGAATLQPGLADATTQPLGTGLVSSARLIGRLDAGAADAGGANAAGVDAVQVDAAGGDEAGAEPAAQPTPAFAAVNGKARLLFVDDEERILNALRSIFRSRHTVLTAGSGAEALELIRRFRPHVVVSDQRMPRMSGVELLRQVRDVAPGAVRMLLTGYSDLASIVGSINEGEVFRFISKPWDHAELQNTVAEAAAIGLELAQLAASPVIVPERLACGVLVIDPGRSVFGAATELIGGICPVLHATDIDRALGILEAREIAVIVADLGRGDAAMLAALKLLKQAHPQILAVVMTEASDSELVIDLINQAQVFRFLTRPLDLKRLQQHVRAALARYQSFRKSPMLLQQHRVAAPGEAEGVLAALRERMRLIGSRIGR